MYIEVPMQRDKSFVSTPTSKDCLQNHCRHTLGGFLASIVRLSCRYFSCPQDSPSSRSNPLAHQYQVKGFSEGPDPVSFKTISHQQRLNRVATKTW